jgi:hypothetical protein
VAKLLFNSSPSHRKNHVAIKRLTNERFCFPKKQQANLAKTQHFLLADIF